MWQAGGQEAARYGTYMRYLFEAFLNGQAVPITCPEMKMLQSFVSDLARTSLAWRTEWTIYGEAEQMDE